ncbi:hypothetical protein [Streptomyces sp. CBMA123]|uniref:hypothetical protein n=1 Tax=Streptomyces sp. CBMA123 TaxID=1896313 RepID=UPI001661D2B6|nr:hypothetical protein [Streptomyces sp. CBMA123]MBD0695429.1 hypothetical protein [Streptomyces sp. CBMA123]
MSGGAVVSAPLTRAQKFQWFLEKGLAEGLRRLPASTDEAAARRLVHALEARFEILRTSLAVIDGELRQVVHLSGSPVEVVDLVPGGTVHQGMADLVREFTAHVHGRLGRFLVQFRLLREDGRYWLAVVADNVAVDAGFHGVVEQAITELLGEPSDGPATDVLQGRPGIQPAEQARRETDPGEDAERARALDYLREHFSSAPARLHPHRPPAAGEEGRYYRSTLTLPGADGLFAGVMARAGLLPSAVVLAAFAQLLCGRSDTDGCTVNVSLDNRHNADLRRVLCATAQRSPVALPGRSRSLLEAADEVQRTLAEGHPAYGRYDPFDLIGERIEAQHRRGLCLSTDLAFNFIPPPQGWAELLEAEQGGSDRTGSGISWAATDETSYEYGVSLSVRWADPRTVRLSVHGDSRVLSPEQCAALLRGIELVLTRIAAGQDCAPEDVAAEVGLVRVDRGPREQRAGGRWIDLGAIEERLRSLPGVAEAAVALAPGGAPGAAWLTARVTPVDGTVLSPLDLREELLGAVHTGELLAVPERFEIDGGEASDGRATTRRPPVTAAEGTLLGILAESGLVPDPDLDLCYVRAGGRLERYPRFAELISRSGYRPPGFTRVSGMTTLRGLARELRPSPPAGSRPAAPRADPEPDGSAP